MTVRRRGRMALGMSMGLLLLMSTIWTGRAQQRGAAPGDTEANTFTGKSDRLPSTGMSISRRSFDPGARSYWHSHEGGQLILVQEGRGRVQRRNQKMRELSPGETDYVGPGIEHWHGAVPGQSMTQLAVNLGGGVKWGVAVTDAEYSGKTDNK